MANALFSYNRHWNLLNHKIIFVSNHTYVIVTLVVADCRTSKIALHYSSKENIKLPEYHWKNNRNANFISNISKIFQ